MAFQINGHMKESMMMKSVYGIVKQIVTLTPNIVPRQERPISPDNLTQLLLSPIPEEEARAIYESRQTFLAFHYF